MSFLDNLESSLKNLESREERDPREQQRRQDDRNRALAIRPWADALKNGAYAQKLFEQAAIAGHRIRTKIYIAWIEDSLRLEAKQRRLELKPTSEGIEASFTEPDGTSKTQPLDLKSEPEALLKQWLEV
jgi:hypothetical protein